MPLQVTIKTNSKKYKDYRGLGIASFAASSKEEVEDALKQIKEFMIAISGEVLREEQSKGFGTNYVTLIDGRKGRREEDVKYLGKIEYQREVDISKMVIESYKVILDKSKVVSGLYKSLNYVLLNTQIIATTLPELEAFFEGSPLFFPGSKIVFVNIAPYAQRMELQGVTKGRVSMKMGKSKDKQQRSGPQVRKPNGVYALSVRSIKRAYGKLAKVKFELLPSDYLGFTRPIPPNSKQKFRATFDPKGKYNSGFYILPTISITLGEEGVGGVM
jgi:hypothetical protein